jgi:hypothetical protein
MIHRERKMQLACRHRRKTWTSMTAESSHFQQLEGRNGREKKKWWNEEVEKNRQNYILPTLKYIVHLFIPNSHGVVVCCKYGLRKHQPYSRKESLYLRLWRGLFDAFSKVVALYAEPCSRSSSQSFVDQLLELRSQSSASTERTITVCCLALFWRYSDSIKHQHCWNTLCKKEVAGMETS